MRQSGKELVLAIARIALPALYDYFEIGREHDGCVAINAYYEIESLLKELAIEPVNRGLPDPIPQVDGKRWESTDAFVSTCVAIATLEQELGVSLGLTIGDVNRFAELLNERGHWVAHRDEQST